MWRKMLEAALELIYPPRPGCPLCGSAGPRDALCPACKQLLARYARENQCPVCGLYGVPDPTVPCRDCQTGVRSFQLARAVGPYEGPLREAIHRLKYRGQRGLARPLGALMAGAALREPAYAHTRGLVPVPLFAERQRQRGFNQALLLARELEEPLAAPVLEGVVVKTRATPPQTRLPRSARLQNLNRAFTLTDTKTVAGKTITIIDDVLTTGATASTISQLLRQAGARAVLVLTLAGPRYYAKK